MFETTDYTGKIVNLRYTETEDVYSDEKGQCYKLLTDETDFSVHVPEPEQNIHPELFSAFWDEGIMLDLQHNVYDPVKCEKGDHEPVNGFQLVQYILLVDGDEYGHGPYNEELVLHLLQDRYPITDAIMLDGSTINGVSWGWDCFNIDGGTVEYSTVDWPATLEPLL